MRNDGKGISRRDFVKAGLVVTGAVAGAHVLPVGRALAAPKDVKVGLLAPLTGVSASWGERSYWGYQLAAEALNAAGGIKAMGGAKFAIVVADTESKPEVAGIQAEKLISDKDIVAICGTNQSAAGMVATQVAERLRTPFLTGVDGAPQITQRGFKYTYRTCPVMTNYAKDLMFFAKEMGEKTGKVVKKVAILCENSIFGVSGGDAAAEYAKKAGFEVADYSTYDAATTRDFSGYISKYKSAGVELLACHSRPQDGVFITRTMKELDYNPICYGGMFGTHAIYDFAEALGKDSNHTFATTSFTAEADVPGLKNFCKKYKEQFKVEADANMIAGFSVLAVLKAALEKKPTMDREELKKALDGVEIGAGENNNLQIDGVKWDDKHDNALVQAFVIQWKDGVQYPVAPAKYATRKPVWPRPTWAEISKGV